MTRPPPDDFTDPPPVLHCLRWPDPALCLYIGFNLRLLQRNSSDLHVNMQRFGYTAAPEQLFLGEVPTVACPKLLSEALGTLKLGLQWMQEMCALLILCWQWCPSGSGYSEMRSAMDAGNVRTADLVLAVVSVRLWVL